VPDPTITALARAALQNLEANRQRIDDLNVYPVPDGDTGSNLADTVTRLTQGLEQLAPGPIVLCARHVSIADALLPADDTASRRQQAVRVGRHLPARDLRRVAESERLHNPLSLHQSHHGSQFGLRGKHRERGRGARFLELGDFDKFRRAREGREEDVHSRY
jgi:hypothetical protein